MNSSNFIFIGPTKDVRYAIKVEDISGLSRLPRALKSPDETKPGTSLGAFKAALNFLLLFARKRIEKKARQSPPLWTRLERAS